MTLNTLSDLTMFSSIVHEANGNLPTPNNRDDLE